MNYEDFFQEARDRSLALHFDNPSAGFAHKLSNEAMFLLPLLAISVLMLARGKKKPKLDELGQLLGECMERTFVGFTGSSQHLGWSANLRIRTISALTFLEAAKLVQVTKQRVLATPLGTKVLSRTLSDDSNLAYTLRSVERSYIDINSERQLRLELR